MTNRCIVVSYAAFVGALWAAAGNAQPAAALDAVPDEERNARLIAAIREAGFVCAEIVDVMLAEAAKPAWRVVCNDALVYLAAPADNGRQIRVEPLPYTDPIGPTELTQPPADELPPRNVPDR